MGVKVKRQAETEGPFEKCVICTTPTPYWWSDGCAPLCTKCAAKTTDRSIYVLAEQEGYGPLPDWDELPADHRENLFN